MGRWVFLLILALAQSCLRAQASVEEVLLPTSVRKQLPAPWLGCPLAAVLKACLMCTGARCSTRGAGVPGAGSQCYST